MTMNLSTSRAKKDLPKVMADLICKGQAQGRKGWQVKIKGSYPYVD